MATFKHTGGVSKFGQKLISGMVANGYEQEFAEKTFKQLEGISRPRKVGGWLRISCCSHLV
jgi:DNA polymerase III alpha subunit